MAATEPALVLGIGCQRGTSRELLARGVDALLAAHGLALARVCALATVAHKRNEPGLCAFAAERGWRLAFYSTSELGEGVAEPAALRCAGGALLLSKQVYREAGVPGSMTLAVAAWREPGP